MELIIRFETQPGHKCRWISLRFERNNTTLKAFVATLGYSRATFVKFYDHERTDAWIDGLENAFQFFAGVPQEILFDNAKTIMIERDAYQEGQQNGTPQTARLRQEVQVRPRVCKPDPCAQTKGKSNALVILKSSFIVPLKASLKTSGLLLDVDVANAHIGLVAAWKLPISGFFTPPPRKKSAVPLQQEQKNLRHYRNQIQVPALYLLQQHSMSCPTRVCSIPYLMMSCWEFPENCNTTV